MKSMYIAFILLMSGLMAGCQSKKMLVELVGDGFSIENTYHEIKLTNDTNEPLYAIVNVSDKNGFEKISSKTQILPGHYSIYRYITWCDIYSDKFMFMLIQKFDKEMTPNVQAPMRCVATNLFSGLDYKTMDHMSGVDFRYIQPIKFEMAVEDECNLFAIEKYIGISTKKVVDKLFDVKLKIQQSPVENIAHGNEDSQER